MQKVLHKADCLKLLNYEVINFFGLAAMVETLVAKTRAWEEERGVTFTYDGVPLLAMLDEYAMLRHEREEEKRRLKVSITSLKQNYFCLHGLVVYNSPSNFTPFLDMKQNFGKAGTYWACLLLLRSFEF